MIIIKKFKENIVSIKKGLTTVKAGTLGQGIKSNSAVEIIKKEILATRKMMPISITQDGFIVDGEHRYKALMELGVIDIPVYIGKQAGTSGRLIEPYSGISVEVNILNLRGNK